MYLYNVIYILLQSTLKEDENKPILYDYYHESC